MFKLESKKLLMVILLLVVSLASCKKLNDSIVANPSGKKTFDHVSCTENSKEVKESLKNIVNLQDDKIFQLSNNTTFEVTYEEDECFRVTERYSTVLANQNDNWGIIAHSKIYKNINGCLKIKENKFEAEINRFYMKNQFLNEIENNRDLNLKIDTQRDCYYRFESDRNSMTLQLFLDGKEENKTVWDFKNITHKSEFALRINNETYMKKIAPVMLHDTELDSVVKNCINRNSSNVCTSTERTLRDWLEINQF